MYCGVLQNVDNNAFMEIPSKTIYTNKTNVKPVDLPQNDHCKR